MADVLQSPPSEFQERTEPAIRHYKRVRTPERRGASVLHVSLEKTAQEAEVPGEPKTPLIRVVDQKSFPKKLEEPKGVVPNLPAEAMPLYKQFAELHMILLQVDAQAKEMKKEVEARIAEKQGEVEYTVLVAERQRQLEQLIRVLDVLPDKMAHLRELVAAYWPAHKERSQTIQTLDFVDALIAEMPNQEARIRELFAKVRSYKQVPDTLVQVDVSGFPKAWREQHLGSLDLRRVAASENPLEDLLFLATQIDNSLDKFITQATDATITSDQRRVMLKVYAQVSPVPEEEGVTPPEEKVKVRITGTDGNAFAILGTVKNAMRQSRLYTPEQIKAFMDEAMSGDYDHLLQVCTKWADVS
jgi:hypothetical protein